MPSTNKTPNIGLNQWQGNEYPKRQDFIEDNLAIDTKFKEVEDKFSGINVPSKPSDIGAETPTGAQEKANKAETNAKAYTDTKIETVNASLDNIIQQKGAVNGIASLDEAGKIPPTQLPSMNYIPTSEKGKANGVAGLDSQGKLQKSLLKMTRTQLYDSSTTASTITVSNIDFSKALKTTILVTGAKSMSTDLLFNNTLIATAPAEVSGAVGVIVMEVDYLGNYRYNAVTPFDGTNATFKAIIGNMVMPNVGKFSSLTGAIKITGSGCWLNIYTEV